MKFSTVLLFFALFVSIIACSEKTNDKTSVDKAAETQTKTEKGIHKVEILEFKDVPQYTYLLVKEGNKEYWIAVTTTKVEKGETIYFTNPLEMRNFKSSALNKTFDLIYFVNSIARSADAFNENAMRSGGMTGMVSPHGKTMNKTDEKEKAEKPVVKVEKAEGELTVAQIFEKSAELSGKEITLKGKVTKFLPEIMNKNWIHIQDGTEFNGYSDLVATTKENFKVGDIVTIKAKLETNIDYGYGYKYEVILQDAVKEK